MNALCKTNLYPVFLILVASLFIQSCVTKNRFLSQVSETEQVAAQLEDEKQKRINLEDEAVRLKNRIADLASELLATKEAAANTEKKLKERIAVLDIQRNAAMDMGAFVERSLNEEIQRLKDELEKEKILVDEKNAEIAKLSESLQLTEGDLARMKRELDESSKAHQDLVSGLEKEIEAGSVKITQIKNRLSVEIVDKILFASGSDQITPEGQGVLEKVSAVLKDVKENDIRIEGHTDNVPIGPRIIAKFPSNWELSTARSTQVVRFLSDHNVPPENLQAAGFSKYRPVDTNDTPDGRQRNRRIEIVLFPRDISRIVESGN